MSAFANYYDRPFIWGESDCCQFVGDCIEASTGHNPAADFTYHDEQGAKTYIALHGGLPGILTYLFGEPQNEPDDKHFVTYVDDLGVVGVVYRDRIVIRTVNDINDLPLNRASRFWGP